LERPQISLRLIEVLCDRLRWTSDIIEDTVFRDVRSRLAKRLLGLMESYGEVGEGGTRINLKMSQESLGAMLGATRESINKELRRWQSAGVLQQEGGFITVIEPEALAEYADRVS
jgi:CRP-like cAMP-binding protein